MNSALTHGICDALLDEDLRVQLVQHPELRAVLGKHDTEEQPSRPKRSYDVTTQSVTISTIHSVKGFDYACVFVIGLAWLDGSRWTETQVKNLTYVAITRARERLYIPHLFPVVLLDRLRKSKDAP